MNREVEISELNIQKKSEMIRFCNFFLYSLKKYKTELRNILIHKQKNIALKH